MEEKKTPGQTIPGPEIKVDSMTKLPLGLLYEIIAYAPKVLCLTLCLSPSLKHKVSQGHGLL